MLIILLDVAFIMSCLTSLDIQPSNPLQFKTVSMFILHMSPQVVS